MCSFSIVFGNLIGDPIYPIVRLKDPIATQLIIHHRGGQESNGGCSNMVILFSPINIIACEVKLFMSMDSCATYIYASSSY